MSYYSPDAISTDNQKAPCTFELAVPQLTALNAGAKIENGTKLELPLWLAEMLAVSKPTGQDQPSLATLDLPPALGQRVMNALRADPRSVEIRAQAQFFYGMGERMLELFDDDELVNVLMDTFKQRALEIADKAQNTKVSSDFTKGLDENERQLFKAAHEGSKAVNDWFANAKRI